MPTALRIEGQKGATTFKTGNNNRYLEVEHKQTIQFIEKLALIRPRLLENSLGMYQFQRSTDGDVKFASLSTPKHLLRPRGRGCTWDPHGKIKMGLEGGVTMCPIQYQGEHCPDPFWEGCLEDIFVGKGNAIHDMYATPEGRAIVAKLIERIFVGLGNSFFDLAYWGKHPIIQDSYDNDWYTVDDDEMEDYMAQMSSCRGWMTIIDELKKKGLHNFNVDISQADVSGKQYIGQVSGDGGLFERLIRETSTEQKIAAKYGSFGPFAGKGVIKVTEGIFNKYEKELVQEYGHLDMMFSYKMNGEFCRINGCDASLPAQGTLKYKGYVVVCVDEWTLCDDILGIVSHRAMLCSQGIFCLAYDVSTLKQFSGLGLRINQKLDAPDNGKIYMDTYLKIGTAISDQEYMTSACLILTPDELGKTKK